MENEIALRKPSSSLAQSLASIKVRYGGVGPEHVRLIAGDPEIFEAFYRQYVEAIEAGAATK